MKGRILLPSLNRIKLLEQFFEAYRKTDSAMEGLLLVDRWDYATNEKGYSALQLPQGWALVKTEAVSMGDKFREVWDRYKDDEFVCILNDDHVPLTPKWDALLSAQMTPYQILFTNDNYQAPQRIAGAICIGGAIFRSLGYLFPNGIEHLYSDSAWEYLAAKSGCAKYVPEIVVEHRHAYKDNTLIDDTFKKVNGDNAIEELKATGQCSGGFWKSDREKFDKWLAATAASDAQKVLELQPKQGLMIATPSHDGTCYMGYGLGLADIAIALSQNGIHFEMARVVGSSLIPHARNSLVDMFLKSKCQKLLFVDSDQGFTRNDVLHLFGSNKRIIAGITPHKRFPINLNFEPMTEDMKYFKDFTNKSVEEMQAFAKEKADAKGEVEVARAGTGFLMVDRSVFEIMKEKVGRYKPFDNDPSVEHWEFFRMGGHEGKFRGEDWMFTQLAKELDIPIFINLNSLPSHHGSYTWSVTGAQ